MKAAAAITKSSNNKISLTNGMAQAGARPGTRTALAAVKGFLIACGFTEVEKLFENQLNDFALYSRGPARI
jgi:hypothetical protein